MRRNALRRSGTAAIGLMACLYGGSGDALAESIEVTACASGDAADKGARYVLTSDIDCAGEPSPVLAMANRSELDLGGYTLSNGDVLCSGNCRIVGPGTISGGGVFTDEKITVLRATITGSPSNGVLAVGATGLARATIIDSLITGSAMHGVEADRMTKVVRSQIMGNGRHGVAVSQQRFNDCSRGRIRAWASEISGNGLDATCGTSEACADVASCAYRGPRLRGTVCDTSYELGSGMPGRTCDVCSLD